MAHAANSRTSALAIVRPSMTAITAASPCQACNRQLLNQCFREAQGFIWFELADHTFEG